MKKIILGIFTFVIALMLVACGDENQTDVKPTSVEVTGPTEVFVGETITLTGKVLPEKASQVIEWTTSDKNIATVSDGTVAGVGEGSCNIIATAKGTTIKLRYAVTVKVNSENPTLPTSVEITGLSEVIVGETINLIAKVNPASASQKVVWTSSDETVAKVVLGVVNGIKEGTCKIIATAEGTEIKQEYNVTVKIKAIEENVNLPIPTEFNGIAKSGNYYLTTVGQADLEMVYNILLAAGANQEYLDAHQKKNLSASEVVKVGNEKPVVFLVTGTSQKGLGEAGINVDTEKARAKDFADKADAGDIILIVIHVGGETRRGALTDPVVNVVAPSADLMLVVESGNTDNFFTNLSTTNNVPLNLFTKSSKMATAFISMLGL